MKKSLYNIGDKVTVSFLGSERESEIINVKIHPQDSNKFIYTALDNKGRVIPYVGINGSEKYANIFTSESEKINSKNNNNGNKKSKRKSEQDVEEAS